MRILFLDDMPERHETFLQRTNPIHEVVYVWTVPEALKALKENGPFDLASFDHDLGSGWPDGCALARAMVDPEFPREARPRRVIVHSWNMVRGYEMEKTFLDAGIPARYKAF